MASTISPSDILLQMQIIFPLYMNESKHLNVNLLNRKHSYSSLSHGHEHSYEASELFDEQDVNKEGEELLGLKMFDKNPKVIVSNFDENVLPNVLPNDYPKGAKLGTALHEIFELMDFENYEDDIESLIINSFISYGIAINESWIEATKVMVDNVVNALLKTSDNKTFKLNEISNAKNEMLEPDEYALRYNGDYRLCTHYKSSGRSSSFFKKDK